MRLQSGGSRCASTSTKNQKHVSSICSFLERTVGSPVYRRHYLHVGKPPAIRDRGATFTFRPCWPTTVCNRDKSPLCPDRQSVPSFHTFGKKKKSSRTAPGYTYTSIRTDRQTPPWSSSSHFDFGYAGGDWGTLRYLTNLMSVFDAANGGLTTP